MNLSGKKKTCQVERRKPHQILGNHRGGREKRGAGCDLTEEIAFGLGIVHKSLAGRDGEKMVIMMGYAYELLGTT